MFRRRNKAASKDPQDPEDSEDPGGASNAHDDDYDDHAEEEEEEEEEEEDIHRSTGGLDPFDKDIGRVRAHDIPSDGDSNDSDLWAELGQGQPGDIRGGSRRDDRFRNRSRKKVKKAEQAAQEGARRQRAGEEGSEELQDSAEEGQLTTKEMIEILWKERNESGRGRAEKNHQREDSDEEESTYSHDEVDQSVPPFRSAPSDEGRTVQFAQEEDVVYIGQRKKMRDNYRDSSQRSLNHGWRGGKVEDTSKAKPKKKTALFESSTHSGKDKGLHAEQNELLKEAKTPHERAPGEKYVVQYKEGVERRGWAPATWPPNSMVVGSVTSQWASAQGIEVGDELLAIDGFPVKRMSKPFLVEGMKRRPANLLFVRHFEHAEHEYGQYAPPPRKQKPQSNGVHLGFRGDNHMWQPPWGCTVLHEAAATGNLHLARFSIARSPAMAAFRDSNGRAPLHYAAQEGHAALLPVVAGLSEDAYKVELSSDDLFCDAVDFLGCSPLWLASRNGHVPCCKWLLDHHADPMRRARDGTCAVWQAARSPAGRQDPPLTLAVLLASVMPLPFSGSRTHELPRFDEKLLLRDLVDHNGYTIFHAAAYDGVIAVIRWIALHLESFLLGLLVAHRARGGSGETALHLAVLNDHLETADLLRDMGASTMGGKRAFGSELHDTESDEEDDRSKTHREARFSLHPF